MQNTTPVTHYSDGATRKNFRRLLTGFSFIVFGLGSLDLGLIILPLIMLTSFNKDARRIRIQAAISWHFRTFLRLIQALGLMSLNIQGLEKLKTDKGVIIIANHPTLIDVVVIMAFLPEVDCVVKEGLNRNIFLRRIVRSAGYITNSNPESLFSDCKDRLNQGRNIIIFPEGTRSIEGQPLKFQRGVSRIALLTEHSIRPLYLKCEPGTLSKQQKWYDIPDKPFVFSMKVGDTIDTQRIIESDKPISIKTRQLTRQLEKQYLHKLAETH